MAQRLNSKIRITLSDLKLLSKQELKISLNKLLTGNIRGNIHLGESIDRSLGGTDVKKTF